tara:strand:- start:675 stop:1274 length:600 start_codon:yes stop_codon:yes gene_type:complete
LAHINAPNNALNNEDELSQIAMWESVGWAELFMMNYDPRKRLNKGSCNNKHLIKCMKQVLKKKGVKMSADPKTTKLDYKVLHKKVCATISSKKSYKKRLSNLFGNAELSKPNKGNAEEYSKRQYTSADDNVISRCILDSDSLVAAYRKAARMLNRTSNAIAQRHYATRVKNKQINPKKRKRTRIKFDDRNSFRKHIGKW